MLSHLRSQYVALLFVVILSFVVRGLTSYFIREHLSDPSWFQSGTYAQFDAQAQNILNGKESAFWIGDPANTAAAVYPPGYSLLVAVIYKVTGVRSAESVQIVQWVLDSWSVLLILGIGVTAFDWRIGITSGFLAALSPLLTLHGVTPLADAPTSWLVLSATWLLIFSFKRDQPALALVSGLLLGASCWLRSNALLLPIFFVIAFFIAGRARGGKRQLLFAGALLLGAFVLIMPLTIRNARTFHVFTPAGLGVGTNLWEGIGETSRAAEFGAVYGDRELVEQERAQQNIPAGETFTLYYPNGVQRDRERARKAFAVIRAHPVWYAGVMLRRMAGLLKYAGDPAPYVGSSGINVTSSKTLPESRRGGFVAFVVNTLGMVQSVLRYVLLPLMILGVWFASRRDLRVTMLLLTPVIYYLVVGSALHTEIRYGLPMQALLVVFAGLGLSEVCGMTGKISRRFRG
jgi:hypothetical protein